MDGFTKVNNRKRWARRGSIPKINKRPQTSNRIETLNQVIEEIHGSGEEVDKQKNQGKNSKDEQGSNPKASQVKTEDIEMQGEETKYIDIEKSCANPKTRYILSQQVILLREAILKSQPSKNLGVIPTTPKDNNGVKKQWGRISNRVRIKEVGEKLVASGQYPIIKEAFQAITKSC